MSNTMRSKAHRHSQSATITMNTPASKNPGNSHYMNIQAQNGESQIENNTYSQPTTPPRTPRKVDDLHAGGPESKSKSTATDNGSKQRSKNKSRTKASPATTKSSGNSPPATSNSVPISKKSVATPSTAAYAGPTFHASPAPSALPIPSFYSKSVPDSPEIKGIHTLKVKNTSPDENQSTPQSAQDLGNQSQREESPLDLFFRADREEKARAQSTGSTQSASIGKGPFRPPSNTPYFSRTPSETSQKRPGLHAKTPSASGMFAMELDSPANPSTPYGPAFSTPYSERISAARSTSGSNLKLQNQNVSDFQDRMDRSEALKAYLFSGQPLAPCSNLPVISGSPSPSNSEGLPSNARQSPISKKDEGGVFESTQASQYAQFNRSSPSHDKTMTHGPKFPLRSSGLRQEFDTAHQRASPRGHKIYNNISANARSHITAPFSPSSSFGGIQSPHSAPQSSSSKYYAAADDRDNELRNMEESLRRILKLDGVGSTSSSIPQSETLSSSFNGKMIESTRFY